MSWENPKTNWGQSGQTVPIADDFNRIEGNIQHLQDTKETPAGAQAKAEAAAGAVQAELNMHKADNAAHVPHLGTATNSGNNYSITSTKVINDGAKFSVKFNVAATGAATLKISSDGTARALKKPGGGDFKPKAGIYTLIRDGSNFQLLGEGGEYGTATASDVLSGKTIGTENGLVTGTMPNRGAVTNTITTQGGQYTIPSGYHNGSGKVTASFANLTAGNVKKGVNIGGVVGTYETEIISGTGIMKCRKGTSADIINRDGGDYEQISSSTSKITSASLFVLCEDGYKGFTIQNLGPYKIISNNEGVINSGQTVESGYSPVIYNPNKSSVKITTKTTSVTYSEYIK